MCVGLHVFSVCVGLHVGLSVGPHVVLSVGLHVDLGVHLGVGLGTGLVVGPSIGLGFTLHFVGNILNLESIYTNYIKNKMINYKMINFLRTRDYIILHSSLTTDQPDQPSTRETNVAESKK